MKLSEAGRTIILALGSTNTPALDFTPRDLGELASWGLVNVIDGTAMLTKAGESVRRSLLDANRRAEEDAS